MRRLNATEAKAHLAEILRSVEHGATVAITRHGREVAHLIPPPAHDSAAREESVERFARRRATWALDRIAGEELLALRHEGHRV